MTPAILDRWRFVLWQLAPDERRALVRWVVARTTVGRKDWREGLKSARTVTFVCHGNIIRSPVAAVAFETEARRSGSPKAVRSAGVAARDGELPDPRAVQAARERGFALNGHRAHFFDEAEARTADLIFVMDLPNAGRVIGAFPATMDKVFLLGGIEPAGTMSLREIRDPVLGTLDDVRKSHDEVLEGIRIAATALTPR
jgi:protein-tyrosine phosphatase